MAWIKLQTDLPRNPKLRRLARTLGISVPSALGLLILLWHFCAEYGDGGDLSGISGEEIADAMLWEKSHRELISALVKSEFLSDEYAVIGWESIRPYPPEMPMREAWKVIYKSATKAVFLRDGEFCVFCGTTDNLTIDHKRPISKGGGNELSNLQVLCRSCNCRKKDKYDVD